MSEILKSDISKIVLDCLGVLYVDSNTVYNSDFRKNIPSKLQKLEIFINLDFTEEDLVHINSKFGINTILGNLPAIKGNQETDSFFDSLIFWTYYDVSLCYAFMYEPYKTIEYFEKAYEYSKKLKEITIYQIISKYGERMFYHIDCLGFYKYEDLYESIKPVYFHFINIYCKIKWLFEQYYNKISNNVMLESREHEADYWKSLYHNQEKFQIQTKEQAENLLKYKRISKDRYNKTLLRLNNSQKEFESTISLSNQFKSKNGFMRLEDKEVSDFVSEKNEYILKSNWTCNRYYELNKAQKIEYQEIYYSNQILSDNIFKYERVRVHQIIFYLFKNPNDFFNKDLSNEINFFGNIKSFEKYSYLKEIYDYLLTIERNELYKRLELFLYIDEVTKRLPEDSQLQALKIIIGTNYLNFIKHTSEEISNYLKTGSYEIKKIGNDNKIKMNKCLEKLVFDTPEAKKYHEVFYKKNSISPEKYITICENYIQSIIDNKSRWSVYENNDYFGKGFQLGYIINDLTATCSKIKNWEKTLYWLDLFFNGDSIYKWGASKSKIEKMKKRFETAKGKL